MAVLLPALLVLLLLPFAGGGPAAAEAPGVTADVARVATPQDRSFIDLFLRAAFAAIEAGELARAQSPQTTVRDYGSTLARHYEDASRQLARLAAPLHLPPLPDEPDSEHKASADRLRRAGPARFDQQFLATQVRELQDLIRILEIEATTGDHLALRKFATRLLPETHDHLLQARTLAATLPGAVPLTGPAEAAAAPSPPGR
ncbi:MAG: hypothetical protein K0Q68_1093 [Moraxellaceae bacterium]|jgi:predicted outer membrane protein|nr:hypothetical protein [Moraxellaceae bacterium]